MERKTLILSAPEVLQCLDMDEVIQVVEETFRESGLGRTILPPKLFMYLSGDGRQDFIFAGPASVPSMKAIGVKIVTGYKDNPARFGLPHILGTMILTDFENGYPLAIFDGVELTNARTGAMTAVAAKYLARRESSSLAIIGGGTQGRSTVRALCRLFPVQDIRLFDVDPRAGKRFEEEMSALVNLPVCICLTSQEVVEGADIIVTATTAEGEFIRNEWVNPGSFIASIGSYPELDSALPLKVDKVVVDDRAQARYRGELWRGFERGIFTDELVYAELGEIVCGKQRGRETPEERTLACMTGVGTLDVAVARRVYEIARERNLGTFFRLHS